MCDGLVENHQGAGAALIFKGSEFTFPGELKRKRPKIDPDPDLGLEYKIISMKRAPSGRVSSASDAELVALHLGIDQLIEK